MAKPTSDRRLLRRFLRHWYARPFWLGVLVLGLLLAGRLALTPAADRTVRGALAEMPSVRVSYRDLSIFSLPATAVFSDVEVTDLDGQRVLSLPRFEVHFSWRDVIRGVAAGVWPYPEPKVRLRIVRPWLEVRSEAPQAIATQLREMLDGVPGLHVEVAGIEQARVSVGGSGRDCARDLDIGLRDLELGPAAAASTFGEDPPRVPLITRSEVSLPDICRRPVRPGAAPAGTVAVTLP